ncbi:MAG: hypothetical protein IPM12_02920 [Flavobacteriales bacterium]|nr:hypothetical protein [Flavobacteriales bacterium]MBK9146756.1 hypothetical protein [Flavobacteriales bacterium]
MSWDIFIQDFPDVPSINDVPDAFRPKPIGNRDELIARIREAIPFIDQVDSDWLFAKGDDIDVSFQLHMEDATQVRYMVAHVHGGEQSAACIGALLRQLGLRGHDTATGELFDGLSLDEGL